MDRVEWLFDTERSTVILLTIVFVLSVGLALFRRSVEWSGAAVLAAFIGSTVYFVLGCIRYGFGPLFVIGLGLPFIYGVFLALPTVGVIRGVLALMARKT